MILEQRPRQAGFSLAEVVVSLGLLAGVLISMAGLLAMGNRQVRAGRSRSEALAVVRHVQEDFGRCGFQRAYTRFDCDAGLPSCRADETSANADAVALQALVAGKLTAGRVSVLFESLEESGTAPDLGDASAIRITVGVRWREGLRDRSVELATVRM